MTPGEVSDKFEVIAKLNKELAAAEEDGVDVFAPDGFLEAKRLYTEAFEMASEGKGGRAVHLANKGLSAFARGKSDAKCAQDIMWEVIDFRQRARKAGAPELFMEKYKATEKKLAEANCLIESNNIAKAVESQKDAAKIADEGQKRIGELEAELKGLHDKYESELSGQAKRFTERGTTS